MVDRTLADGVNLWRQSHAQPLVIEARAVPEAGARNAKTARRKAVTVGVVCHVSKTASVHAHVSGSSEYLIWWEEKKRKTKKKMS